MDIVIYSKPNCPWCVKAKELMNKLHLEYSEKILDVDYTRDELRELVNGSAPVSMTPPLTVPQIFVYNKRVGGYEDFVEYCDNHGLNER
jgi:glutaredoxin